MKVTVRTPSRLHFGIVDMRGDLGRIYGSVGVAIERPYLMIKASSGESLKAKGPRSERVLEYSRTLLGELHSNRGAEFEVVTDIPEHQGFGSGTQLALAVGNAASRLYDLDLSIEDIAIKLSRSKHSGIGTYAFARGGFIVDGGHRTDRPNTVPPLVFRSDIPRNWLFVVGVPSITRGINGAKEAKAFERLEPPPGSLVGEAARRVLMGMIPAIIEGEIEAFGEAMTALDDTFGEYWLKIQGGRYSHPAIEAGVNHLREAGAYGVGQSSWGPAFYGLVKGEKMASELTSDLSEFLSSGGRRGEAFYTHANNHGAEIKVEK